MSSSAPQTKAQIKSQQRYRNVQHYLVCYQHIPRRSSKRWHASLRRYGTRQMNGVYLIESKKHTLKNIIEIAQNITKEGGSVSLYPLCKPCHAHTLHVGAPPPDSDQPYYIV